MNKNSSNTIAHSSHASWSMAHMLHSSHYSVDNKQMSKHRTRTKTLPISAIRKALYELSDTFTHTIEIDTHFLNLTLLKKMKLMKRK